MNTLHVTNIKCGGCQAKITKELEKVGASHIAISLEDQTVSFEGDENAARTTLSRLGYPEAGTKEAASLAKKAKSYVTCAIGKMEK